MARSCLRRLTVGCAGLAGIVAVVTLGYAGIRWLSWPDIEALRAANPATTAFIERYERRTGKAVELRWAPWERMDLELKYAVVVAEDSEFLDHDGFSTHEVWAAIEKAWKERSAPRGASTITQQLAKNLWLSPSYNPLRKIEEALLTRALERNLSKRRILEIYLNVVEFGPGIYGVGQAAPYYFRRSPRRVSARQSAMLAASLPRPSQWHPGVDSRSYARYVETVLARMKRFEGLRERIEGL